MTAIRQPVFFDKSVLDRLKRHVKSKYGNRRALSATIQYAVTTYLDKEEGNVTKAKTAKARLPKAL